MKTITIGLDIAKNVFHAVFVTSHGKVTKKKQMKRAAVLKFFANTEPAIVVMEACGSSNYWAREIQKLGHEVKLIAPQYVVAYRRKNKNDYNDAEAIAECSQRDDMSFVPIKDIEQQDAQMLLRIRERLVKQRTKLSNQIRGMLLEYGLCINKGTAALRRAVPEFLEDADNSLTWTARSLFSELYEEYLLLSDKIEKVDKKIKAFTKENELCQLAQTVTGIGPITALALYAAIGNGKHFANGRHFAAWCGLVPRQHSTGGKSVLYGISKKGNIVLRALLVHGARSVLNVVDKKEDKLSVWATNLKMKKSYNVACVALANKLARVVWSVIANNRPYELKMV
ncbi:transposase [Vibrio breoganii]|uniref:IS110 family transposase n=1 Tax=Vibrio breoganii TaxID=553239 RepID=UPI000C817776|nr:IS110 family transposase [Vibrio breoganii]PMO70879.1 transposase [Vibrio breoganii]